MLCVCSAYSGYVIGLGTTIVVMNIFEAAQPALLYIVPAVLAAVLGHAAINQQFLEVKLNFHGTCVFCLFQFHSWTVSNTPSACLPFKLNDATGAMPPRKCKTRDNPLGCKHGCKLALRICNH